MYYGNYISEFQFRVSVCGRIAPKKHIGVNSLLLLYILNSKSDGCLLDSVSICSALEVDSHQQPLLCSLEYTVLVHELNRASHCLHFVNFIRMIRMSQLWWWKKKCCMRPPPPIFFFFGHHCNTMVWTEQKQHKAICPVHAMSKAAQCCLTHLVWVGP